MVVESARFEVRAATEADDAGIRKMLREGIMSGPTGITLEREPNASLAATIEGERHYTVIGRDRGSGELVGTGSRSVRAVWLNGERRLLGYLGSFRGDRGGGLPPRRVLQEGFRLLEDTRQPDELPFDVTSVAVANEPARRLLEAGIRGLPVYEPLFEVTTLLIPTRRGRLSRTSISRSTDARVQAGSVSALSGVVACLQQNLSRYQFAPAWKEADLLSAEATRGLEVDDFAVATRDGDVCGCVAVWDQRAFKQVVVRAYEPRLRRTRPLVNVGMWFAGRPVLPRQGEQIALGYLSHLAVDDDDPALLLRLVDAGVKRARARGLDYAATGLASDNPMLPVLRRAFPCRSYETVIYAVHRGNESARSYLNERLGHVEVAVL